MPEFHFSRNLGTWEYRDLTFCRKNRACLIIQFWGLGFLYDSYVDGVRRGGYSWALSQLTSRGRRFCLFLNRKGTVSPVLSSLIVVWLDLIRRRTCDGFTKFVVPSLIFIWINIDIQPSGILTENAQFISFIPNLLRAELF